MGSLPGCLTRGHDCRPRVIAFPPSRGKDLSVEALPFSEEPAEDAGASTASRYRFQYCRAAARLLAAIAAGRDMEILCELHEDYVVLDDRPIEAVSVKHREQSKGLWTLSALTGDGKLAHLFETFERADGDVHCTFESNRAHSVADLWADDEALRKATREDLAKRLGVELGRLSPFVDHLTLDDELPGRAHIASTYASDFAAPALDRLSLSQPDPTRAMGIATDLVARASQEQISSEALRGVLLAQPGDRAEVLASFQISDRSVCTDELREALSEAASATVPRIPAATSEQATPQPDTTMSRKLRRGGLGPSVLATAGRRRALWYAHRARYRDITPREEELNSLQEWVQDQANSAEITASKDQSEDYGGPMYEELMGRLSTADALPTGTRREDSDPALLSGAAFELTDACSVWWSPQFSIEETDEDA